jgi:hypothetical protein
MQTMKINPPWWLWLVIFFEILPMFLGPLLALNNPEFFGGPGAVTVGMAAYLYSARNLAVGLAFILACVLRNGPMLFILIFIRLFTDLMDLPILLALERANSELRLVAIFVFIYYIPAVIALRYLWQRISQSS